MIWSTPYHHVTILVHRSWPHLLFTVASVHQRQVLLKLHRHMRSLASKPSTCPSQLQPVRRAKPHLDFLHLGHMTPYHVSYAISSFIITCASFLTSPSYFHLHDICCSHTCTCGLTTCVSSHKTPLVHLGCHSIIKTKQGPFNLPFLIIDDNLTKIWKLSSFRFMLLVQAILPYVKDMDKFHEPKLIVFDQYKYYYHM
jgi:hypothetical protein